MILKKALALVGTLSTLALVACGQGGSEKPQTSETKTIGDSAGSIFAKNVGTHEGRNLKGESCVVEFKEGGKMYYGLSGDASAGMDSISAGSFSSHPINPVLTHKGGGLGDVLGAGRDKSELHVNYDFFTKKVKSVEFFWNGTLEKKCELAK